MARLGQRWLILGFLIGAIALTLPPPAQAAPCHTWHGREICIITLKRSAKYFWEYRAQLVIDGQRQPPTRYNCRDRTQTPKGGPTKSFNTESAGAFLCELMRR